MTPLEQMQEKILKLEEMILAKVPTLPTLLRDIHSQLKADDSIVTLLSESEVHTIVQGLKVQTKTEIATKVAAAKPKGVSLKNTSLDML